MTLIEVSLSLVVLAVGVMGAAGLQLRALQASEQARGHSQAVWLAQGLLERARAGAALGEVDQAEWHLQLRQLLGKEAQGLIRRMGHHVQVEVQWGRTAAGEPLSVSLQGSLAR